MEVSGIYTEIRSNTKKYLKKAVKYLLDKCYFKLRSKIFRKLIGIHMNSDPALFFANLTYLLIWIYLLK